MPGLFRRFPNLSPAEWDELRAVVDHRPDVLAVGRGEGALVVAQRDILTVRQADQWQVMGWHEIQRGGWRSEDQALSWELVDGSRGSVVLSDPGQVPSVFRERVQASIVVNEQVTVPDDRGQVIIVGRRNLGTDEPLRWLVEPVGRTNLSDPWVRDFVVLQTERIRAEYTG